MVQVIACRRIWRSVRRSLCSNGRKRDCFAARSQDELNGVAGRVAGKSPYFRSADWSPTELKTKPTLPVATFIRGLTAHQTVLDQTFVERSGTRFGFFFGLREPTSGDIYILDVSIIRLSVAAEAQRMVRRLFDRTSSAQLLVRKVFGRSRIVKWLIK